MYFTFPKVHLIHLSTTSLKVSQIQTQKNVFRTDFWGKNQLSIDYYCPQNFTTAAVTLHTVYTIDTGHFFNTSLIQVLVFKGIVKGQESKVWAFFKGLRSFRGPQKQN